MQLLLVWWNQVMPSECLEWVEAINFISLVSDPWVSVFRDPVHKKQRKDLYNYPVQRKCILVFLSQFCRSWSGNVPLPALASHYHFPYEPSVSNLLEQQAIPCDLAAATSNCFSSQCPSFLVLPPPLAPHIAISHPQWQNGRPNLVALISSVCHRIAGRKSRKDCR